jgi:putative DNA primase/helicase
VESEPAPPPEPWRKYPQTDRGNAERVIALCGNVLCWSPLLDRWLRYEGGAWRESKTGGEKSVLEMLGQLTGLEAGLYSDVDVPVGRGKVQNERADFLKWLREQQSSVKVKAAAQMIKFLGELDASLAQFDAEPMLLNAPNGIIDLHTGELLEHNPKLMLRRQIPVPFDPEAKAPRWERFLERVMPSTDMRDYLQRIIGYTLTGRTTEQVVFFHVGPAASGKSVFLRIMEAVLGDFSRIVPPTTLLNKKIEQHPTDVMGMEGRRMLQVSETAEGARLDEALIKRLSGEETNTARGMGQDFRDFRIVGKVHLVTNHDPRISDDPAVHRRLHYVPWMQQIPLEERDPMLAEEIMAEELPGVLAWAVRGSIRWRQDRLKRPVEAELARAEYLASTDDFSQFVEDELILGADGTFTATTAIRQRYVEWSRERGFNAERVSVHAITKRMKARGHESTRRTRERGFGVALQAPKWVRDPLS